MHKFWYFYSSYNKRVVSIVTLGKSTLGSVCNEGQNYMYIHILCRYLELLKIRHIIAKYIINATINAKRMLMKGLQIGFDSE